MSSSNWNNAMPGSGNPISANAVAGYFASGDDAHRAINELMEAGFKTSDIGAAFHSRAFVETGSSRINTQAVDDVPTRLASEPDSTVAGVASGTNAVTPSGLSTGGGTVIAGASQPGPIPGSEIPANLPTHIPSELPSDPGPAGTVSASAPTGTNLPATGGFHEPGERETEHEGWWDKLKHAFGGETADTTARRQPVSDKSSLNYGTGEGHLGVYPDTGYAYSGSAFEQSFSGMGIPGDHSRRLSRDLHHGGAVVTVNAGTRNADAEAILERNHGIVRYEGGVSAGEESWDSGAANERVEIFGEVHRVYPGYIPADDVSRRKAS